MPATFATETTREGLFASTRWTMVLDAGESQTPPDQALSALSELCRIYWRPIFLFLRRQGSNPDDAQDLTQGFFAHLIESRAYARADRVNEREWAETLLRTALDRLAEECALAGKDELFKQLNSHLSVASEAAVPYEEMSLRLGRPITTLRSDVAR